MPYGLELSVRIAMPGGDRTRRLAVTSNCAGNGRLGDGRRWRSGRSRSTAISCSTVGAGVRPAAGLAGTSDDGREAIAVAFVPKMEVAAAPAEVIFLIDRSGSMAGRVDRGSPERDAAVPALHDHRLPVQHRRLRVDVRGLVPGEPSRTTSRALPRPAITRRSLTPTSAGRRSFRHSKRAPAAAIPSCPRQVVILTDGQVTNTDAVLELVRRMRRTPRVFAFGIGAGVQPALVRGDRARRRRIGGVHRPGERIEPKVVRLFSRLLTPAFTDARLDWGGLRGAAAPSQHAAGLSGERLVMYGFVERVQPATLRLSGIVPSGPFTFEVPLEPQSADPGPSVSTLAARAGSASSRRARSGFRRAVRDSRDRGRASHRARSSISRCATT